MGREGWHELRRIAFGTDGSHYRGIISVARLNVEGSSNSFERYFMLFQQSVLVTALVSLHDLSRCDQTA